MCGILMHTLTHFQDKNRENIIKSEMIGDSDSIFKHTYT